MKNKFSYQPLLATISEWCPENDIVLITPVTEKSDRILQVGPTGQLELISTDGLVGLKTRAMNARCFCGMIRKGILVYF